MLLRSSTSVLRRAPPAIRVAQRRMAGGFDGRPRTDHTKHVGGPNIIGHTQNMAIEKYAKYKEDYHMRFKWTPQRVRDCLLWAVGFPLFLYTLVKTEQIRVDQQNGRTDGKKDYL